MTTPLNGHPRTLHAASELLYASLEGYQWFRSVEIDQDGQRLLVETKDISAAGEWLRTLKAGCWCGWRVDLRRGQALVS